ncbi:MAG: hypothetical protein M1409_05755, partial [Actinobacteria bacterium]|nr:hypothetical protein [Actinomycetota bacterium]
SLIEVYPETGRTHQIRVHLAFIGHPVIGDKTYGNRETEKIAKEIGLNRQFLHAKRIVLTHPVTGKEIDLIADLPDDLSDSIDLLNLQYHI